MTATLLTALFGFVCGFCEAGRDRQQAIDGLARHNRRMELAARLHKAQIELAELRVKHAEIVKDIARHREQMAFDTLVQSLRQTLPGEAAADAARAKRLIEARAARDGK